MNAAPSALFALPAAAPVNVDGIQSLLLQLLGVAMVVVACTTLNASLVFASAQSRAT